MVISSSISDGTHSDLEMSDCTDSPSFTSDNPELPDIPQSSYPEHSEHSAEIITDDAEPLSTDYKPKRITSKQVGAINRTKTLLYVDGWLDIDRFILVGLKSY